MLDLANDAIIIVDAEGQISFWNRGTERMYGWSKEEAVGRNAHDLLRSEFPQAPGAIEAAVVSQGHWQGELKHTTHSGEQLLIASRWNLYVDENGKRLGTFEINRDVTSQSAPKMRCGVPRSWPPPDAWPPPSPTRSTIPWRPSPT